MMHLVWNPEDADNGQAAHRSPRQGSSTDCTQALPWRGKKPLGLGWLGWVVSHIGDILEWEQKFSMYTRLPSEFILSQTWTTCAMVLVLTTKTGFSQLLAEESVCCHKLAAGLLFILWGVDHAPLAKAGFRALCNFYGWEDKCDRRTFIAHWRVFSPD